MTKAATKALPYLIATLRHDKMRISALVQKHFPKGIGEPQPGIFLGETNAKTETPRRFQRVLTCRMLPATYARWLKNGCNDFQCERAYAIKPALNEAWSIFPTDEECSREAVICIFREIRSLAGEGMSLFPGHIIKQERIIGLCDPSGDGNRCGDTVAIMPKNKKFIVQYQKSFGLFRTYIWTGKELKAF